MATLAVRHATSHDSGGPKLDLLVQSALFRGLTREEMATFEALTSMSRRACGDIVIAPWQTPDAIFILKRGSVRLSRVDESGARLTVAILDTGAVFGESRLLGQGASDVTVEAMDDCLVCTVPTAQMRELMHRFPTVALNLAEFLGNRLRRSHELAHELAYWNVHRRIARQVALLAERYGRPTLTGDVIVDRVVTQSDLAEMVGATRQTVSESLSTMTRLGIVGRRRRRLVVRDADALAGFDGTPAAPYASA